MQPYYYIFSRFRFGKSIVDSSEANNPKNDDYCPIKNQEFQRRVNAFIIFGLRFKDDDDDEFKRRVNAFIVFGLSANVTRRNCPLSTVRDVVSAHRAQEPSQPEQNASSPLDLTTIAGDQMPTTTFHPQQGPNSRLEP